MCIHTCAHMHTRTQVSSGQALQCPAKVYTSSTPTLTLCQPLPLLNPATTTALGCPGSLAPTPGGRWACEKEGSPPEWSC